MQIIDGIPVWGEPLENAVAQMRNCLKTADKAALMADHHLGYAVPVGGVIAYEGKISPSGVGFDIACGNKAVKLDVRAEEIQKYINTIMDDVYRHVAFGIGRRNDVSVEHPLFEADEWNLPFLAELKLMAQAQLGTVGSGNHYVDLFEGSDGFAWIGVHFGSRGLGHKIATHFIKAGGGTDGINVDPVVLDASSDLGDQYLACMNLAGRYAYAGRDWVCRCVADIIGSNITDEVHNHHNFAWNELHEGRMLWVVRKGATPAFPGQRGFVGGTMGEFSVILEGVEHPDAELSMYSTVHGAGRAMSRTEAAGKSKWVKGVKTRVSEGKVSREMMDNWLSKANVELRGGGVDESPHCYKRLHDVLQAHENTIKITEILTPMGVAMASPETIDPYKD